jgi:hypothetical protein
MGRRIVLLSAALCVVACGSTGGGSADGGGADGETDASWADTSMQQESGSPETSGGDAGTDAPSRTDAGTDAESHTDAGTDADAATHTDAATDSASDAASDSVADSAADAGPDAVADSAPDAASDSASVPDAVADSAHESGAPDASDGSTVGPITGGPCSSGAAGATAIRIEFIDAAGTADVQWLVEGDPDRSNDTAGTYGYTIPFTPSYVDQFLAQGGVALDSSDFIDIGMSTVGLTSITSATLSVYGRSYDVSTNGSFNWQTFDGTGQTATDFVSNVPPYQWYSADMTTEIRPGENNVLVRIKAGPSSNSLVVNRVEICLVAQ